MTKAPQSKAKQPQASAAAVEPFWRTKSLEAMTTAEWESLCDGCGRCCLNKLEEEETGTIHLTAVACKLLDIPSCRCRNYADRFTEVPDCVALTPRNVRTIRWLPHTCAYRLVAEGQDLASWHPLVSGRSETVQEAGIAVAGWAKSERRIKLKNFERYIIDDYPGG